MNKYLKYAAFSFVGFVGLFIASEIRIGTSWTRGYVVKKGKQNFKPNETFLPYFQVKGFEVYAVFDSSAWYGPDEWSVNDTLDQDWHDWNKLKGFSSMLSPKNKQTAMYAYRPDTAEYTMQVAAYTNDKKGDWKVGPIVKVKCGQNFIGKLTWTSSRAIYRYGEFTVEHEIPRPWMAIETGTWIGGANNAPGPYGGKAHKEMKILIETRMK